MDWDPEVAGADGFETGRFLADFSYAGYRSGAVPLPQVTGPIFHAAAAPYHADPTGTTDSTAAIQAAIDAAGAAGGGVVLLPAGTFRLSVGNGFTEALRLIKPGVVLRGAGRDATFLLNTTTNMRSKAVIRVSGPTAASYFTSLSSGTRLRGDVLQPTRRVRLENVTDFAPGDHVVVRHDVTEAWVAEHNETSWTGLASSIRGANYLRQVVAVDAVDRALVLDAPIFYYLRTRDAARVRRLNTAPLSEVGLEDFSMGNLPHPGSGFGEDDYNLAGTAAYDVHDAYLIRYERVRDSWISRVGSYRPVGSPSTAHLLSLGVLLVESSRVTVAECHFQRPQYGGGGGNGYMYRIQSSGLCLIRDSAATFSRHGFMFSHMSTAGSVLLRCTDTITGRAVGSSGVNGYATNGKGSDHHMHFSHANLIDSCIADDSWFEARYRGTSGTTPHALAAAHTAFWNMEGRGTASQAVVTTEQARYGYAIGTSGTRTAVSRPGVARSKTDPLDHVEGVGEGATLEPSSLYEDQLARRLQRPRAQLAAAVTLPFPARTVRLVAASPQVGALAVGWEELSPTWEATDAGVVLTSGLPGEVTVTVPEPGDWTVTLVLTAGAETTRLPVTVTAEGSWPTAVVTVKASADATVRGGTNGDIPYGSEARIELKEDGNDSFDRRAVLRFPLADLAGREVRSARLVLNTAGLPAEAAQWAVQVHALTGEWEETTVTWNAAPVFGDAVLSYAPAMDRVDRLEITDFLVSHLGAGEADLNLGLAVLSQVGTSVLSYHAREAGASGPLLEVEVDLPELTVATWAATFAGVPENARDALADPDGDGELNVWEMIWGLDPSVADASPGLALDVSAAELRFRLAAALPWGLGLALEGSSDLEAWQDLGWEADWITVEADGRRRVAVPLDFSPATTFWRLRASLP